MSDPYDVSRPIPTATRSGSGGVDPHANVGAYAVDALEPPERAEFRAHLESCEACRREVAEFRATTAELSALVATKPPAELRAATLAGIRAIEPLAPEPPRSKVRPLRRRAEQVAPLDDHPSVMPWALELGTPPVSELPRRRRGLSRRLVALAAAVVVVALALGGWVVVTTAQRQAEIAAARADADRQTELLSAPDATLRATTLNGAPVTFIVSKQQNRALFVGESVPAPGAGKVYQLWAVDGTTPVSAGVAAGGGSVRVWLDVPVADADQLAVTVEPGPDGSAQPTSTPLAGVKL